MPSATPPPAREGGRAVTGTEAEAAALLGWLTDPEAPRLCLVTGAPGSGKTALLDWLAAHGPRAGGRRRRTPRVLVPLAGQSALGATWTIADLLGVVARSPDELVHALATSEARPSGRAVLLLTDLHAAAEPAALTELIGELAGVGRVRLVVEARTGSPAPGTLRAARRATVVDLDADGEPAPADGAPAESPRPLPDLSDPLAVCAADPLLVTTAYVTGTGESSGEAGVDDHGGLRTAWLRAGQSLCRAQAPAERALVLLAALGDGADPRLRPALAELAEGAAWRLRWARNRGDLTPPWPGPVAVLGAAGGPLEGTLLVGDRTGTVRLLHEADASSAGRLPHTVPGRVTALAPAPDGTVLLLDDRGRLHSVRGTVPRAPYLERLTEAVSKTLARHPGTALAAIAGSVVVGDRLGSVHAFGLTGLHQAAPHSGRVTAVAAVESETPFVCSGGADGTVRLWTPGRDPRPEPLAERRSPVVSLHAAETPYGPLVAAAWADGLVELHRPEGGATLSFRPGPPVRAVAVTGAGALLVGTDESLVCLVPRSREKFFRSSRESSSER
ncbi:WD40 repeat domain-containing protein [Streptomyces sp. NBC_01255]|uniref:WD40 repeat domain-containing protein n=1 Tax=Streptomyces sp. NBC_01255 TaxID=2903798 RepID=UPI002E35D7EB|nr:WD40 repeat domain-containing protein [Streptomyces sp. NBC_01255]